MSVGRQELLAWLERSAAGLLGEQAAADGTGFGHRRRRSRHQHGPRLHGGQGGAGLQRRRPTSAPCFRPWPPCSSAPWAAPPGRLYGTFFLRAGAACAGKDGARRRRRGGAVPGGRRRASGSAAKPSRATRPWSMPCCPRWHAMQKALAGDGSLAAILDGRRGGRRSRACWSTIPMQARKGRASYLGPRSIGHQDPGATSSWLLMRAAAERVARRRSA